jgi:DNA-directed RNA polymerase specialized sigma24 family protein
MEEKLHRALASISPKLRIAYQMREMSGLSTKETAKALGITVNTLKSRMIRARAALSLRLGSVVRRRPADRLIPVDVN